MKKKKEIAILGVVAAVFVGYVANKIIQKSSKRSSLKAQGIVYYNEGDYKKAIEVLSNIKDPDYKIYLMLSDSNQKTGDFSNALIYLNKCIKMNRSTDLILKRHEIHKILDLGYEAFKDLFVLSMIEKNGVYKESASSFLKKYSANKTKAHKITGWASDINFSDFFENLFFLCDQQDPSVVFINSKEYKKCYDFVSSSGEPLHQFLLGCFNFVNGNIGEGIRILEKTQDFPYSRILLKYIRVKRLTATEIEDLKKSIKTQEDPTILYFMSKIFEITNDVSCQDECLDGLLKIQPSPVGFNAKIIRLFKQGHHEEASKLINESLARYPDNINLICISLEYFMAAKEIENFRTILQKAEGAFKDDPRICLFQFMESELDGKPKPEFLRKAIELDDKYFKPYIYLGNSLSDGHECARIFRKALECARTHDEIFTAYQLLTVVEAQNDIFNEHPDLFSK